jgi:hypothetical protein
MAACHDCQLAGPWGQSIADPRRRRRSRNRLFHFVEISAAHAAFAARATFSQYRRKRNDNFNTASTA